MLLGAMQRLLQRSQWTSSLLLGCEQQQHVASVAFQSSNSVCSGLFTGTKKSQSGLASASRSQQHIFAAAYSTDAVVQQQSEQQQQTAEPKMPDNWRPFFYNGAQSRIKSRKPAIKRPARHQWHYCNPNYDPWDPLPKQNLPPYAPPSAFQKDYRAIYFAEKPLHNRKQ